MRLTRTRTLLLAILLATACGPQMPSESAPKLVTLGRFEGEIDVDAGTFTVRSVPTSVPAGGAASQLVIATGASTVTIGNNGAAVQGAGTGTCNGFTVLAAPVRITLGASNTGFAGGLYAEIQNISGTGGDACNSATPPTGSGLSATLGLWSYGTVRSGATTADQTWNLKVTSGQKTTFSGRIVGVPGTAFAVTNPYSPPGSYSPIIAYTRTWTTGADGVAYALGGSAGLAYLNLAGTSLGTVVTPELVTSVATYTGAAATDDLLWFTTDRNVGVVYRGTMYSTAGGSTNLRSVVVDPSTANRAWFASLDGRWFRSVTFDTGTHAFSLGTTVSTTYAPFSIEIGRTTNAQSNWLVYVAANQFYGAAPNANWIGTYDLAGVAQATLTVAAACEIPYTFVRGTDGKLWFANCRNAGGCGYCNYDPATATFSSVPVSGSSGTLGVARSTTGAGDGVWAFNLRGKSSNPVVHQAVELVQGASATSMFAVDLPDSADFGSYPTGNVPTLCGSPAVGATPAYLWWTSNRAIYRMQPQ